MEHRFERNGLIMKRICRFIKALWKYIWFGNRVSFVQYITRLMDCKYCTYLNHDKWMCGVCGCYVDKKAKMSTEKCPKYKWQ